MTVRRYETFNTRIEPNMIVRHVHVPNENARFLDNCYPSGNFDVESTLKFRRRESVEKRKNYSTLVEKASKFRRRIDVDISAVL